MRAFPTATLQERVNSFLTETGQFSFMRENLLYIFGSCERHSKSTKEMYIPFETDTKVRHSLLSFVSTEQLTETGRINYLIQRKYSAEFTSSGFVCLLVGWLTSQQHASACQGRICLDNFTCCHTEIEVADQTFYLTQSQYTDTGPTSPSADPITPGD